MLVAMGLSSSTKLHSMHADVVSFFSEGWLLNSRDRTRVRSTPYSDPISAPRSKGSLSGAPIKLGVPIQSLAILICAWTLVHGISAVDGD
jgi:hypothetical protein